MEEQPNANQALLAAVAQCIRTAGPFTNARSVTFHVRLNEHTGRPLEVILTPEYKISATNNT